MWKALPYLASIGAVLAIFAWVDHRAYHSGKEDAEKTCADTTVPKAKAEVQAVCDALTNATKEENDALTRDINGLRATYDRLRQQKPIVAKCLPLAPISCGDAGSSNSAKHTTGVGVNTEWLDRAFYDVNTDIAFGESCKRKLKNIYILNGVKL
jgi:hypothetical protein